eukprot:TRINITY_DN22883_c0_g1_i1.p1 TRINITY_DN22883_c0_g1~~TRINITY_DN22883_c0_g1_i1.p1  ORF type:complete len:1798 (+),score=689.77 TRINITY_DN22883_c0_g1_i1:793-5394(+)
MPKELPELWRGTKVLPNLHSWGLGMGARPSEMITPKNYKVDEWEAAKAQGDSFDLGSMVGTVTKVSIKDLIVQVQWEGQEQKMWYRAGRDEAHDVVPISHAPLSDESPRDAAGGFVTQWNPLDLFTAKQIRHMLMVLRQMNQLVIKSIEILRATYETNLTRSKYQKLIQQALLPEPGWLGLYSVFSSFMDSYDNLMRSESQTYRESWAAEAPTLKRELIKGIFDPRFPARDRYNLLLSCKIIDEDINPEEPSEPIADEASIDIEQQRTTAPLTRSKTDKEKIQAWEELERWRNSNKFTMEGLRLVRGIVTKWTKESANTRTVKEALDRLIPKLATRLQSNDNTGKSAVLNTIFMNCVLRDAAAMMYQTEKTLRGKTGSHLEDPVEVVQQRCREEVQRLIAPFDTSDSDSGPKYMLRLVQQLEKVSLLQTSEAIETLIEWTPRQSGEDFVKEMKSLSRSDRRQDADVEEKSMLDTIKGGAKQVMKTVLRSPFSRACDYMEGRLGSAIGEYFRFCKFIIEINFVCFWIWVYFILAPWVDWVVNDVSNNGTATDVNVDLGKAFGNMVGILGHTEYNASNVTHPFSIAREEGDWFLYGAYPTRLDINYRIGAAYTAACFLTLIVTFLFISVEVGKRVKQTPSSMSQRSNLELFKAKWTRILRRMGKNVSFSTARLSLVDQPIDSADTSLDPPSCQEIEESARMQAVEMENAINLFSWPIGLSDAEGTKLKLESSRQFWELQHALIDYQEAELEHDGRCCSALRIRQYKTYVGWWLSLCIFIESFVLLFLILDNRDKLNRDYNDYVAPLLIAAVNSGTPVILKKIVQILEYYEDHRHTVYHIIVRQFCCKMSNMVWVVLQSLNTTNKPGQRCTVNDTATLIYQLITTTLVIEVLLFFGAGVGLMLLGKLLLFPMALKDIFIRTTNLKTPNKYRPTKNSSVSWPASGEEGVEIKGDANETPRVMYFKVSKIVDLYEEPKQEAVELEQAKEVVLQKQHAGEDETAALKQVKKLQAKAMEKKKAVLTEEIQKAKLEVGTFLQSKLHTDRDALFQTYVFKLNDYVKCYDMRDILLGIKKLNNAKIITKREKTGQGISLSENACLSFTSNMCPSKPGVVGYHVPVDTKPKWVTVKDLIPLDQYGELKDDIRSQILTDTEKKKIKQLDTHIQAKIKHVLRLQEVYGKLTVEKDRKEAKKAKGKDDLTDEAYAEVIEGLEKRIVNAEDEINKERLAIREQVRLRVYLKQKKDYTDKINSLLARLTHARENLPPADGKSEFELPQQVMSFLYLQSLVWAGSVFSPMMMFQGFLATTIWFVTQVYFVDWLHVGSRRPLAIGSTSIFFYYLMGVVLFVAMIPIAAFMDTTMDCGPHSGTTPIHGFWEWAGGWPRPLDKIAYWFFSPFVLVSIICLQFGILILAYMKYSSLSHEVTNAYKELAEQKAEGKENSAFMQRYTLDVQNYQRSSLLLEPQKMIDEGDSGIFIGSKGSVNLSYTNTFGTVMCSMLGESPLEKFESNVLNGYNAPVLKKVRQVKEKTMQRTSSIW